MSGSLLVRVRDAYRRPLDDHADVHVVRAGSSSIVKAVKDRSTSRALRIRPIDDDRAYHVRVFPRRHRAVGALTMVPPGGEGEVEVFCPLVPERVVEVRFPGYGELDGELQDLLERSDRIEGLENRKGEELWGRLSDLERAGLLNLWAKMHRTVLAGDEAGRPVSAFLENLYRVRGDRVFADVALELRDRVKLAESAGQFRSAPGALHTPPPGFERAGSFKSDDDYGNLQLTFFASSEAPLRFKVDADIDDAAGLRHLFHVLEHHLTGSDTHPYDIHQILVFWQRLDPGYRPIV